MPVELGSYPPVFGDAYSETESAVCGPLTIEIDESCENDEKAVAALDGEPAELAKRGERGEVVTDVLEVLELCRTCSGR